MSEQGGPYGPGNQGPGRPQGPQGPQGWQQPGSGPTGPQGWQQPGSPATGPQGWQGPQNPRPQGWQQPGAHPAGPQGWQQGPGQGQPGQVPPGYGPPPTQGFPGPGGPGSPFNPQPAPTKSRTPIIITAVAVVVALLAAVGVWFFAFRDAGTSTASGQASPQESVTALFTTLSNSDPIGLADQLDPAEAALFTDLNSDLITELKRLEILSPEASTEVMTGTTITVSGLTYDGADEVINDHLRIVKLTGGTVTIASDPNAIPLSDKFKETFGEEIDQAQPQSQTINIADLVAENDGQPLRLATVQRDGMWYVSLFYTIADNAVHEAGLSNPTEADFIAPKGSESPEAAVQAFTDAATAGRIADVIAVLPPDEMGVLHDYGQVFINAGDAGDLGSTMTDLGFTIDDISWDVSDVTGGKKVSLASLTATVEGQTVTLTRDVDAGSVTLTVPGQPEVTLDQDTIDTYLTDALGTGEIDQQGLDIIKREFSQLIGLGVVTVEVDGQWYVSPVRSVFDVVLSLMKGLEPGDIDYLISLSGN